MKAEPITLMNHPSEFLKDLLLERKAKNPSYSARAFARDLGLSQAFLSQVMNGRRNLSLEQKLKLASHLGISEADDFEPTPQVEVLQNTIEHEKILKHWYHFGILELISTDFKSPDPKLISKRLGISELEAKTALTRLIDFGYVDVDRKGILKRTKAPFLIDAKKSTQALRAYHQSRLQAAHQELERFDENSVANRHFQTMFIPTSRERVRAAKKMADAFQKKMIQFLLDGKPEEVFQLSLQLFSAEKTPTQKPNSKNGVKDEI